MPQEKGKTPKKLSIDFTGVERGGGGRNPHVEEGDYLMQIVGCTLRSKKDDPSRKFLAWEAIFKEAMPGNKQAQKAIGKKFTNRTSLVKENLWSLRGLLIDMLGEKNVPQSAVDVPIAAIVAKKPLVGYTMVDDDPYEGKEQSKVAGTFSKKDWADLKASAVAEDEDEDEEDEDEEEEEEADETEDEEEEEEDEEEEEEKPVKKSKKAKKEKKAKKKKVVEEDDEDEDEEELDLDDL